MLLFLDVVEEKYWEVFFVREINDYIVVWEGEKLIKECVFEVSGIKIVYWLSEFDKVFFELMI